MKTEDHRTPVEIERDKLISQLEMEMELLRDDIFVVTSDVSIRVIEEAIDSRRDTVESLVS